MAVQDDHEDMHTFSDQDYPVDFQEALQHPMREVLRARATMGSRARPAPYRAHPAPGARENRDYAPNGLAAR